MSKDVAQNTLISSLPNWLRWVLFIPLALAVMLLVSYLGTFLMTIVNLDGNFFVDMSRVGFMGIAFILTASAIAPKRQSRVALILGIIGSSFTILLTLLGVILGAINGGLAALNIGGVILFVLLVLGGSTVSYLIIRRLENGK